MILGRLGRMAYINTLPVDWGVAKGNLGDLVTVRRGAPTELARLLAEGELDVSPVPAVAAAQHAREWLVLDHLCIGCRGAVGSVILHSDRLIEEMDHGAVAVTRESATAARLVELLLAEHWGLKARLVDHDRPAQARLLIGDSALRAAQGTDQGYFYDLGSAWKAHTGLDFVFGVWCIRRRFAEEYPERAHAMYHALKLSRCMGRLDAADVVAEAVRIIGLSEPQVRSYFQKLVYEPEHGLWTGLRHFLSLIGYNPYELEFFGEKGRRPIHSFARSGFPKSFPDGISWQLR